MDLLDDDVLGLVAATLWATGVPPRGLLGASRRTRAVALAALTALKLRWCAQCAAADTASAGTTDDYNDLYAADAGGEGEAGVGGERGRRRRQQRRRSPRCTHFGSAGGGGGAGGVPLPADLDAVLALLACRPARLRALTLVDGDGGDVDSSDENAYAPVDDDTASSAARAATWRRVGDAAAATCPLRSLSVVGEAVAALTAFGGTRVGGGGGPPRLRLLHMKLHASTVDDQPSAAAAAAGAAVCAVGDGLGELAATCTGMWPAVAVAPPFGANPRLPALRTLRLLLPNEVLSVPTAAAVAESCPGLTNLTVVAAGMEAGVGAPWGLSAGGLPDLALLSLTVTGGRCDTFVKALGPLLHGRNLVDLHLTALTLADGMRTIIGGCPLRGVAAALRGAAALPAALSIENVPMAEEEWDVLATPPRVDAAALVDLALSPRRAPATVLAGLGPAPSLVTLWVQLDLGLLIPHPPYARAATAAAAAAAASLAVIPWVGMPALRHLTLQLEWLTAYVMRTPAHVAAARRCTPIAWAVASIDATPRTRASLTSLTVIARGGVAADAVKPAAYGPAAGWPSLRSVSLRVEESGWGGTSSSDEDWEACGGGRASRASLPVQARLRRALRRLLPSRVALQVTFEAA